MSESGAGGIDAPAFFFVLPFPSVYTIFLPMSADSVQERIPCPHAVLALVKQFHDHIEEYKSGKYNETQLRQEYINPLFEALERQANATDRQIDQLVYGLTEEEVGIIERANS